MKHKFKEGDNIAYISKAMPTLMLLNKVKKDKRGRLYFKQGTKIFLSEIDKATNYEVCLLPNPDKDFLKALYSVKFFFNVGAINET